MSAPYWGQLPPPKVVRGNSLKRSEDSNRSNLPDDLTIDTDPKGRYPVQAQYPVQPQPSRQNRHSTQTNHTEAPTVSTQSPFASPTASSFRGDGLAPRPSSYGYGATEGGYSRDYLEKRRRRESRNKAYYDDMNSAPPPAAPDAPKPPPPVSYKEPYNNGAVQRSTQRSSGPVGSQRERPEEYYRQRGQYPVDERQGARRSSKGKAIDRNGDAEWDRSKPERLDTIHPRKGSLSEAEDRRRREWAPEKSPLQRLELTLDSITKEEKRARVEEAELLAREEKAGRGGDRAAQNSVRFRNRPVAKATPESASQDAPSSLPEAGLVRNLSNRQRDQLQRSAIVDSKRPVQTQASQANPARGFDYEPRPEVLPDPQRPEDVTAQRKSSTREKSAIPVASAVAGAVGAAGLARNGSNKLKKDPPGDPWYNRRAAAEKTFQEVAPRKASIENRQQETDPALAPSRGTAFGSHPQSGRNKELVSAPKAGGLGLQYPDDPDLDDEMDEKPIRRGSTRKIEQLTGQRTPVQAPPSIPPKQQRTYVRRPSQVENLPSKIRQPEKEVRTELVTVNGIKYTIPPAVGDNPDAPRYGHLSNLLHHGRNQVDPGTGIYTPSRRLDEWKKGGVALLAGDLLDLASPEKTEAEKDKAWWEAGNSGKRRRSSTKQRKAEAYDGEYDDTNGIVPPVSNPIAHPESDCEGCISGRNQLELWLRRHHRSRLPDRSKRAVYEKGNKSSSAKTSFVLRVDS